VVFIATGGWSASCTLTVAVAVPPWPSAIVYVKAVYLPEMIAGLAV
jgi:hypothetical protein